jgi:hypothetical protein
MDATESDVPNYGIFYEGRLLEADFWTESDAWKGAQRYHPDWDLTVKLLCPHHEGQPADECEHCDEED